MPPQALACESCTMPAELLLCFAQRDGVKELTGEAYIAERLFIIHKTAEKGFRQGVFLLIPEYTQ